MTSLAAQIQKSDLFADLPDSVIRQELLPLGHIQEYQKGQLLIQPQQRVEQFGLILSGKVQILHIYSDGRESLMTKLRPGEITGADLVCTRTQISPYYAVAAGPVQVFYLPVELLTRPGRLHEQTRLGIIGRMLQLISDENMKKEYRLAILSQKGLRERIVTYLTMQANRRRKRSFAVSFTREEMASYLCVNRSALSHELSLMQQEGLISFNKNRFTLHGWELDFPE